MKLLTRSQFREAVFERDNYRCVICGAQPDSNIELNAHHVMERALWTAPHQFGGYFLDNGVTLCDHKSFTGSHPCHMLASMTKISPAECRRAARISNVILPEHLYEDAEYTVWGDTILANGLRLPGEMFDEMKEWFREVGVLHLYTNKVKHPRTFHLPFSPKALNDRLGDDRAMPTVEQFLGKRIIVTAKMDGSQATLYRDDLHERSTDFKGGKATSWLQNFHAQIAHDIPEGYRINVENLYVAHDIHYQNLPSFILGWMMWNGMECLSWDETIEYFELIGLPTVKVLYDGIWNEELLKSLYKPTLDGDELEGYVVRLADSFHYRHFNRCVGKYVRLNHRPKHGGEHGVITTNKTR